MGVFQLGNLGNPCCCGGTPIISCTPCNLPQANLTISWTNAFVGPGSLVMTWNGLTLPGTAAWVSVCSFVAVTLGVRYSFTCFGLLKVEYWVSGGPCPGAGSVNCSYTGAPGFVLPLASHTCSPLSMTFDSRTATCPGLTGVGYLEFVVTP